MTNCIGDQNLDLDLDLLRNIILRPLTSSRSAYATSPEAYALCTMSWLALVSSPGRHVSVNCGSTSGPETRETDSYKAILPAATLPPIKII